MTAFVRPGLVTSFFAALAALVPGVASAQIDRWYSGPSEFSANSAWISTASPNGLATLELFCLGGTVMVSYTDSRSFDTVLQGNVEFDIGGKTFRQPGAYDSGTAIPAWIVLGPVDLIDALKSGSSVRVTAPETGTANFSLKGSSAAIAKGTLGCAPLPAMQQAAEQVPNALTPEWVGAKAIEICGGNAEFESDAIQQGEFDGDNIADYLLNWGKVTCTGDVSPALAQGAGNCGALSCTIDVYASSVFDPEGWPQPILANKAIPTRPGSEIKLRTEFAGGSCPAGQVCTAEWVWNGKKLVVKR